MGMTTNRALFASCLALLVGTAWSMPSSAAVGETFKVRKVAAKPTVAVGGTVIPYKEVTLAAQLPGRVKFLAGIEGDAFKDGDALVVLDDRELHAKRRALLAQMGTADAQIRNAGVQYNRELFSPRSRTSPGGMGLPNLFDQMFTRPMEDIVGDRSRGAELNADLFASGTQMQEARNAMLRLQAELQALDSKIRDAKSLAPFDGMIVTKFIEAGDTVQPGQPMLKFADVEYLQVEVNVPARLRPGLSEGLMFSAEIDVDNRRYPVRVAQIYPMADPQRHTVKVKFDLPQGVSEPGMYAKVMIPDFNARSGANPFVPKSAVRYNGSLPGVYVINVETGEPQLRLIRVGEEVQCTSEAGQPVTMPGGCVAILSGLRAEEQVLTNPGSRVSEGWEDQSSANR